MVVELTATQGFLVLVSILALLLAVCHAVVERLQPEEVHRLRDDARRLRDALLRRTDLDPDIAQLLRRFNPRYVNGSKRSSITLHKRAVRICVEPDPAASAEENHAAALFALLHEMAHVMTPEWGHPPNFWQNFDLLLRESRRIGLYDQETLDRVLNRTPPHNLCGHRLSPAYLP